LRKLDAVLSEESLVCQLLALRLAVILCHARRDPDLGGLVLERVRPGERLMRLSCRADWAQAFPQSAHLLREESVAWEKTAWSLEISET
jgi:exopolyphosphatase/guanosine-5'-triphosphate,3'-diphosphate pyrophosphatase